MWRAFMLDATALVDWQLIWHTNASLCEQRPPNHPFQSGLDTDLDPIPPKQSD